MKLLIMMETLENIVSMYPSYDGSISVPFIIEFSWRSWRYYRSPYTSDMRPIADTANFIAVYPQALGDPNDGYSANWIHKDPTDHDDVFFIETLIETLSSVYNRSKENICLWVFFRRGVYL